MNDGGRADTNPLPFAVLVGTAIWAIPLAALVGIVVAIGANTALRSDPQPATATVTLGLTDAVQWPFFEPVRGRLALSIDEELEARVRDQLQDESITITGSVPEELAVVIITATADAGSVAADAADAAAEIVLAEAQGSQIASARDEIEGIKATIAEAEVELVEAQQVIDELLVARGDIDPEDTTAIRNNEDRLAVATRDRNNWQQEVFALEARVSSTTVEMEALKPEATVVAEEFVDDASESASQPALAGAVGLSAALLTGLLIFSVFSRRGPLISAAHLAAVAEGQDTRAWPESHSVGLTRWFQARVSSDQTLGLVGPRNQIWAPPLQRSLRRFQHVEDLPEIIDISAKSDPGDLLRCDSAIVVVSTGTSVANMKRKLAWLDDNEIPITGILFRERKRLGSLGARRSNPTGPTRTKTPTKTDTARAARRSATEPELWTDGLPDTIADPPRVLSGDPSPRRTEKGEPDKPVSRSAGGST